MIKLRLQPGNIVMANLAIGRKTECCMRWIGYVIEIPLVAANTITGYARESIRMTAIAIDFRVCPMQREDGRMLICRVLPTGGYG
jgi:hypothetical protein